MLSCNNEKLYLIIYHMSKVGGNQSQSLSTVLTVEILSHTYQLENVGVKPRGWIASLRVFFRDVLRPNLNPAVTSCGGIKKSTMWLR